MKSRHDTANAGALQVSRPKTLKRTVTDRHQHTKKEKHRCLLELYFLTQKVFYSSTQELNNHPSNNGHNLECEPAFSEQILMLKDNQPKAFLTGCLLPVSQMHLNGFKHSTQSLPAPTPFPSAEKQPSHITGSISHCSIFQVSCDVAT